jgi:hypothetical protein
MSTTYDAAAMIADRRRTIELLALVARAEHDGDPGPIDGLRLELDALERSVETRLDRAIAAGHEPPAAWLRTRLGLTLTEQRVLWLLVLCELAPTIRLLCRALATEQVADPTLDVVRRVVYGADVSPRPWHELGPRGALHRLCLIERTDDPRGSAPAARHTLRASARIVGLIHGSMELDAELDGVAALRDTQVAIGELVLSRGVHDATLAALARPSPVVVAVGARGAGRGSLLIGAAQARGHAVLELDVRALATDAAIATRQLRAIARECRLLRRVPLLRNLEAAAATDAAARMTMIDRELVANVDGPVIATTSTPLAARWSRPITSVTLAPITEGQRAAVWEAALPEAPPEATAALAAQFPLPPASITVAARSARAAADGAPLRPAIVASAVRGIAEHGLAGLATRITVTQTWDDLILPADRITPIAELIARARHRRKVYEQWGFGSKLGRGLGISALFSGPPGTGKTMVAGLIARELGLELYQVDLSQMVSKWIGETEKNLAALFEAAEAGHAVILFDEADSLFGKRTQVSSSNDRYANLEVNYLLQRMESFTGICVLTTNHDAAIDEAFRRRLALHVRFPVPEVDERERIWDAVIPAAAEVEPDLGLRRLAERFEMTGGYIRNAALRAAFLAADQGRAIGPDHLLHSATLEYEGMGKLSGPIGSS